MSVNTPIFKDGGAGGAETDLVKNTTTKDFMRDVVEASREVPVLVDFWAPWCGPCRQLTPILEKAVRAAKGAVRLVKLNIDDHPQIPGQMGVQSIPAVFAFQDPRLVAWGALTNLEYTLTVTESGATKTWHNPAGIYCGGLDANAF